MVQTTNQPPHIVSYCHWDDDIPNSHGTIKNGPNHQPASILYHIAIGMMTFPTEWENKKWSKPPTSYKYPMVRFPAEFRLPRLRDSLVALAQDPANVLTFDWNSDLSQVTKIPSIPKGSQLISRY